MSVTKNALFSVWRSETLPKKRVDALISYVFSDVGEKDNCSKEQIDAIRTKLYKFSSKLAKKWEKSCRNQKLFKNQNTTWLSQDMVLLDKENSITGRPALVDHTVARIIQGYGAAFQGMDNYGNSSTLKAVYKWGCDGSSGHSTYRQRFSDNEVGMVDGHIFSICIVPLLIVDVNNGIVWENERPSSTRFCRPIKIMFEKESVDLVRTEIKNINTQIDHIKSTKLYSFEVNHEFHLTMIDGKVFSSIAESSSQICGICGAGPASFNNLKIIQAKPSKENLYKYGLSTLHAWIRCFECIIHISYRIPIKKWQVRGADKEIVAKRKVEIQNELRKQMGLLVDIPMVGCGNTNNGNTARRLFQEPFLASTITGVHFEIIKRLSVILRTMACGYKVNVEAFRQYTWKTATLFVEEYPWFYMPSSIHKILIHGADIIKNVSLPIGMMSEEAIEARNKDMRKYRLDHTRKNSRMNTMEDLIHALLLTSDPVISSLSKSTSLNSKKYMQLDEEVLFLLEDIPELSNLDEN